MSKQKQQRNSEPQFRVVGLVGRSVSSTRKLYGTGNHSYSYACVIPKSMATALSLTEGSILKFSLDSAKKLVQIQKVEDNE